MKYFTAEEIAMHNTADDCWVSIYEKVYDLTRLIKANRDLLADPIINAAGSSISHWFREDTRDVKTFIDPQRNIRMPYTPYGRFTHVPSPDPLDNCAIIDTPWWVDSSYVVGQLTKKKRVIKIENMLTHASDIVDCCQEETLNEIQVRYLEFNKHAQSYTWKVLKNDEFVPLDMDSTLSQNGVEDESEKFLRLGLAEDFFITTLHVYFNDDLTYA